MVVFPAVLVPGGGETLDPSLEEAGAGQELHPGECSFQKLWEQPEEHSKGWELLPERAGKEGIPLPQPTGAMGSPKAELTKS